MFSNGCTVVGGPDTAGTPSVAPATPLACRRRNVSRYAACSSVSAESSVLAAGLEVGDAPAQSRLGEALLVPELRGVVELEPRRHLGAGVERGDDGVRPPLGLGAVAERVEVDRTGHEAARRRVVDHPQPGGARRQPISTSIE